MPSSSPFFRVFHSWERWALRILLLVFLITLLVLLRRFYVENTLKVPAGGGTYIEGSVGSLMPLNPWFTVQNDVNRDIVSLIFAGLQKYDPRTQQIEDDLATLAVSNDRRIYTLTLKENLFWHDSTAEDPHPVTPEDILFTFHTIQDPEFSNTILRQNFQGVTVEKLDDRRVRFKLDGPYNFFRSNLTIGLLPEKSFEGVPVRLLEQALDFGFAPVGSGPYAFKSLVQTELSTEVTLERFPRAIDEGEYFLKRIVFRIFPDYPTLLSDIRTLDGIRLVPRTDKGEPIIPRGFEAVNYSLPQYVALFFNLDRRFLQDRNLRLGLQLGTDKQSLVNAIGESSIVDTPLLELDVSDWRYKYDAASAQGALFESDWNLPEKVRLQRLLEMREANGQGPLKMEPIVLLETGAVLTFTGSMLTVGLDGKVNGLPLSPNPASSGSWIAALPTVGTGNLKIGTNLVRLTDAHGKTLDSFYVWRTNNPKEYRRAQEEQRLVDLYLLSRRAELPVEKRVSIGNFALDQGMLRTRLGSDPQEIRINDRGDRLSLSLLTSSTPPVYRKVAEQIKKQWESLGVQVTVVVPETREEFEEHLLKREYDLLLFGQSLLSNLDSFPYWHSSGTQRLTGERNDLRIDAYNLSQYSSLKADTLLETIRRTGDDKERQQSLSELRDLLKNDEPAIFLYSPLYTYAHQRDVRGIDLGRLSVHSDRLLTLQKWYIKEERIFQDEKSWWSFFPWIVGMRKEAEPSAMNEQTGDL